jgi:hypothetical protein
MTSSRTACALLCAIGLASGCTDRSTPPGGGAPQQPPVPAPPGPPPAAPPIPTPPAPPPDARPPCTPFTCADLPAGWCGTLQDPCSGRQECGDCGAGVVCRDMPWLGEVCSSCDPLFRTCAELPGSCGLQVNGCGERLECGPCAAPAAPTKGQASWVARLGMRHAGFEPQLAPAPDGSVLVLGSRGADPSLRLERVREGGASLVRAFAFDGVATVTMWLASSGGLLVHVWGPVGDASAAVVDLGGGPHAAPYVAELRTDGTFVRDLCDRGACDPDVHVLDADAHGNVVLVEWRDGAPSTTTLARADGRRVLLVREDAAHVRTGPLAATGCTRAAFTTDGAVVCGGSVRGPVQWGFWSEVAVNPAFTKIDLDARVLWSRSVPGVWSGASGSVGQVTGGGVLAAGTFLGFGRFGADVLDFRAYGPIGAGDGYFLTFAADGTPRRASSAFGDVWSAATAPDGRAAAVLTNESGPSGVVAFDAAGRVASWWSLDPARRGIEYYPASVAVGPGWLFIATEWEGAYDFGPGAAGIADLRDVLVIGAPF